MKWSEDSIHEKDRILSNLGNLIDEEALRLAKSEKIEIVTQQHIWNAVHNVLRNDALMVVID
jgi:hypothetical protein